MNRCGKEICKVRYIYIQRNRQIGRYIYIERKRERDKWKLRYRERDRKRDKESERRQRERNDYGASRELISDVLFLRFAMKMCDNDDEHLSLVQLQAVLRRKKYLTLIDSVLRQVFKPSNHHLTYFFFNGLINITHQSLIFVRVFAFYQKS